MKKRLLVAAFGMLCGEILETKVPPTGQQIATIQREQTATRVANTLPNNQEMAIIQRWFSDKRISSTGLQIGKQALDNNRSLFLIFPVKRTDEQGNLIVPERAAQGLLTNRLRMAGYLAKGILLFGTISEGVFNDITEDAVNLGLRENNYTVGDVIADRQNKPQCTQFLEKYAHILNGN